MIEKKANENLVKDALNSLSFKQQKNFGFFVWIEFKSYMKM